MSRIYLVDTENVASTWQTILPELAADDLLLVFYTKNSPGIAYTDLGTLMQYIGRFSCVECYAGANGLDFQLVSYLGYLLADHPDAEFIIVSRDTGYDAVCKFWTDKGKNVARRTHIVPDETPAEDEPMAEKPADDLRSRISRLLSGVATAEEIGRVADLFEQGDVDQGQMHNALVLSFGAVRGLELYNMLRPVFHSLPTGKTAARRSARVVRRMPVKEPPKPAPVKEAPKPAPVKEAAKPAPVKDEPKPAPVKDEPKPASVKEAPKPEPVPAPAAEPAPKPAKKSSRARRKSADKSPAKPEKADKPEKQPDPQPAETPAAPAVASADITAAAEQPAKKPRRRAPRRKSKEAADKAE